MAQVSRVHDGHELPYGDPFFVWKAQFDIPHFINLISMQDPIYRLLPATLYTDDPVLHSAGPFGNMKEFSRLLFLAYQKGVSQAASSSS